MIQNLKRTLRAGALLAAFLAALLQGASVWAQTCFPTAPRTDTGAGFVAFGANEGVLARGGNSGPAWEWAVGTDTEGGQKVQGSLDWTSGKVYAWTVNYPGTGAATLEIRDQGTLVLSLTYPSGMDVGNALRLQVGTNSSIGSGTTIAATITSIGSNSVSGSISQTGNDQNSAQNLYFFFPPMSTGFTAQGTVSLTYASLPTGSRVDFTLQSGSINCGAGNVSPTVSIASPAGGTVFNAPASITVSANAADADGTVTQVQFLANGNPIGTATASPYTVNWANVAAGSYSLSAIATDNLGFTTTSAPVSVTVNALPTVAITSPASGTVVNAPGSVTLTAAAADADGSVTKVDFYQGATLIGTATSAPYTATVTGLASGNYSFTAVATDNRNATATSAAITVTVNAAPSVSITAPASNTVVQAGSAVTLTAAAADADGSITKVDFFQGATLVGTATAAPFTVTVNGLAAGSYNFTAVATDNNNATATSAAIAVVVNAAPTVNITAPANGAVVNAPANVTITANAADADGTIQKVDFYQGATLLGTATAAPYSFDWTNVAAGTYNLTAVATDNNNATATSAAITVTVNAAPSISITAPANGAVFQNPANVTLTATAADTDGTIAKVDFFQGATLVGTATAAPFTVTVNGLAAGSYNFTAVATDNSNATTTSAAITIRVNAAPTVSLTSPANGATGNAPATLNLAATAADTDGTIAKVEFFQGATLVATVTSAPYTFTLSNVAAGSYSFTAVATDSDGATATSAASMVTVNAAPTVAISAPANNAVYQAPATVTISATAADSDGSITKVDFYQGATLVGTATAAPYSVTLNALAAGAYNFTAVATDNAGVTTTSATISVKVNAAPTVSLTSPTNGASFTAPATVNLAATAADGDGTIAQVEFYNGASLIATVTTAPYTYSWTNVGQGSYAITAKATDNDGGVTTSAVANITVNSGVAQLYFIHTDHLNTPRMIADSTQTTVWKWEHAEPFGGSAPNEDPDGNSQAFEFNLRFPGQYFDKETNLAYNYFRDYDPGIGRYMESDPIGLLGGINTYAYVKGNPISYRDPLGLQQIPFPLPGGVDPGAVAKAMGCAQNPAACAPPPCTCSSPQGPDPNVAGDIMGGSMLGFGTAGAVAGGVAGATIVAGEAAGAGALGGLIAADAVASGAVAGGVVGGAVGAVVGVVAVGGYYYYTSRPANNSCKCPCP